MAWRINLFFFFEESVLRLPRQTKQGHIDHSQTLVGGTEMEQAT